MREMLAGTELILHSSLVYFQIKNYFPFNSSTQMGEMMELVQPEMMYLLVHKLDIKFMLRL